MATNKTRQAVVGSAVGAAMIGLVGAANAATIDAEKGEFTVQGGDSFAKIATQINEQYAGEIKADGGVLNVGLRDLVIVNFGDASKASMKKADGIDVGETYKLPQAVMDHLAQVAAEKEAAEKAAAEAAAKAAEEARLAAEAEKARLAAIEAERAERARVVADLAAQSDTADQSLAAARQTLADAEAEQTASREAREKAEADYAAAVQKKNDKEAEVTAAQQAVDAASAAVKTAEDAFTAASTTASAAPAAPVASAGSAPAAPVVPAALQAAQADLDAKKNDLSIKTAALTTAQADLTAATTTATNAQALIAPAQDREAAAAAAIAPAQHVVADAAVVAENADLKETVNTLQNDVKDGDAELAAANAALNDAQNDLAECKETCAMPADVVERPKPRPAPVAVPDEIIVQKGEELCEIAKKYGLSADEIFKANPQAFGMKGGKKDPDMLYAGATLNLKGLEPTEECGCDAKVVPDPVVRKPKPAVPVAAVPTPTPPATPPAQCVVVQKGHAFTLRPTSSAFSDACGCPDKQYSVTIGGKTIRASGFVGSTAPQCIRDHGGSSSDRPTRPDPKPNPGCGSCNGGGKDDTPNTDGSQGGGGGNQPPGKGDNDGPSKPSGPKGPSGPDSPGKGPGKGNTAPGPGDNGPSGPRGASGPGAGKHAGLELKDNQRQMGGHTFTFTPTFG